VGGTLLHVSQVNIEADSPLLGLELEVAERKFNMTVVMHQSGGELHLHPTSDEVIKEDDTLVVFATLETLGLIGGINHPAEHRHSNLHSVKRMLGRNHA
jgi:Trk K+ transport system NAD-binding subunit